MDGPGGKYGHNSVGCRRRDSDTEQEKSAHLNRRIHDKPGNMFQLKQDNLNSDIDLSNLLHERENNDAVFFPQQFRCLVKC